MDKKLIEELMKKAEELSSKTKQLGESDSYSSVRAEISDVLSKIKKLSDEEKNSLTDVANELHLNLLESLKKDLNKMQNDAKLKIIKCIGEKELQEIRVSFLGKKGKLTSILRSMKDFRGGERPVIGAIANEVR